MKIDMHCHTKEGSIDAKVKVADYASMLCHQGIDGMLVTDHNSFRGYYYYKKIRKEIKLPRPFVVLRGIEYDTRNGGHVLVVMPDNVDKFVLLLLRIRGMSVARLEELVHSHGGIMGAAHPFDTGYYAFTNTNYYKKHPEFIEKFDFIETFNSCAKPEGNKKAARLALKYNKPQTAGTDAHRPEVIGSSYTEFDADIRCCNDLIAAIKSDKHPVIDEASFTSTHRDRHIIIEKLGIVGYWIYNKANAARRIYRNSRK